MLPARARNVADVPTGGGSGVGLLRSASKQGSTRRSAEMARRAAEKPGFWRSARCLVKLLREAPKPCLLRGPPRHLRPSPRGTLLAFHCGVPGNELDRAYPTPRRNSSQDLKDTRGFMELPYHVARSGSPRKVRRAAWPARPSRGWLGSARSAARRPPPPSPAPAPGSARAPPGPARGAAGRPGWSAPTGRASHSR